MNLARIEGAVDLAPRQHVLHEVVARGREAEETGEEQHEERSLP